MITVGSHTENIVSNFSEAVGRAIDESNLSLPVAYSRTALDWLGYDKDEEYFVDGAGDRGLDYWFPIDNGFEIFQVKSINSLEVHEILKKQFDKDCLHDIHRIFNYLTDEKGIPESNKKLKVFKERWSHLVSSKRLAEDEDNNPITLNIGLLLIGKGLTESANDEFLAIQRKYAQSYLFGDVEIIFNLNLYTINSIIDNKWREDNREWRDSNGRKNNKIQLRAENEQSISSPSSAIFYTPAIDLVNAYKNYGYQIFEPNVRCNIKKSKVNSAIKISIKHRSSRKEFKFLNNGVTIICQSYGKPSQNKKHFSITEPGIVNGLQTVISISEAYESLSNEDKKDFEENCYVMVRVLTTKAVKAIDKVVTATNTQNTMEPRNLRSNTPEQIVYEKLFAELGWFYERKQGAWEAFSTDSKRWRTLQNKRKADFQYGTSGRPKYRVIDNEDIAQAWMAFVGFSNIAVHEKSKLFDRDAYYEFLFLTRPKLFAHDLEYSFQKVRENTINQAPEPSLFIVPYLIRIFAKAVTLSSRENYNQAIKRLNIDISQKSREEVVALLSREDANYNLGVALTGMSYTFVEFVGYVLSKSLEVDLDKSGMKLISNGSLKIIFETGSGNEIKDSVISEDFESSDILAVLWHAFRYVVDQMLNGFWADSFRTASNKSRFIAEETTRKTIATGVEQLHRFTLKRQLAQPWAAGIEINKGLFGFVRDLLLNDTSID